MEAPTPVGALGVEEVTFVTAPETAASVYPTTSSTRISAAGEMSTPAVPAQSAASCTSGLGATRHPIAGVFAVVDIVVLLQHVYGVKRETGVRGIADEQGSFVPAAKCYEFPCCVIPEEVGRIDDPRRGRRWAQKPCRGFHRSRVPRL